MIEKTSRPIWKKAMLAELNLYRMTDRLEEIGDDDYTRRWDEKFKDGDSTEAHYYEMFKPDLDYLSTRAYSLWEQLREFRDNRFGLSEEDFNDLCVACLGNVYQVLGFDYAEEDYSAMFDYCEEYAVSESAKRVKRWTKDEMLSNYGKVFMIVVTYLTIAASVDGVETALEAISDEGTRMEMIMKEVAYLYENIVSKHGNNKRFDRAVEKIPVYMWLY
jgi:hypothetical protein